MDAHDYEKLGQLYLGREYDVAKKSSADKSLLLYDSKDLVTHAVAVGMTGSGKTGLCIDLIEEAAIDGVPTIAIDPKGDLTNLLLTFPDLRPEDFRPWVNEEDAARNGVSPDEYAKQQADLWRKGLASWGQDGQRIRRLRDSADFAIYTPGSTAGIPISIVRSFAAPPESLREDVEAFRERITTVATSLLALVGIAADPIKSREHILISTLLSAAWSAGTDLDLETIVTQVQKPPMPRIGALDLETFYPAKDRGELALRINGLIASPGFAGWLQGEALDVAALLRTQAGKPRVSIFSIAHLGDAERMFFVTLLLNEIVGWVRTQSGTTSLRALLYMDEIFGFFPPVAEPPSKRPMLNLLKQARAFGLGVVLTTQNPVDLDYKGLANTGTWFLGRLQTERDKQRVLEGLEGAAAAQNASFDRKQMGELLAGLTSRVFLLNNVHEDAPVVFESRWAMSFLRGPLTREQIKVLMKDRRPQAAAAPAATATRDARAADDQQAREKRDAAVEELRAKYAPKIHRAEEKLRHAQQVVEREKGQVRTAGLQTAVSAGATILTAMFGRKKLSYSTIGRGTTTARGAARAMEQQQDVERAKANVQAAQQELDDLNAEAEAKVNALRAS
jgi:ribosomal protein L12E/L44/L45/RPP1/RPP2